MSQIVHFSSLVVSVVTTNANSQAGGLALSRGLPWLVVLGLLGFPFAAVGQEKGPSGGGPGLPAADAVPTTAGLEGVPAASGWGTHPLAPGTPLVRHVVGEGVAAGGAKERLLYSNTMGRLAIVPGAGNLLADDLSMTSMGGCQPTRIEFDVTGRGDPSGPGGSFDIEFFVFDICPGSVSPSVYPSRILAGGVESFPDDAPRRIVFQVPPGTNFPTNVWFGIRFSRANAGIIGGAPAQRGFSQDVLDFPGLPCAATLGEFPDQPHASFNLSIWGDDTSCRPAHVDYLARQESGSNGTNPGAGVWRVDDVNLLTPRCRMAAYEVVVRGSGRYEFEFRTACAGGAIAGTEKTSFVAAGNADTRSLRFNIDPPVPLAQNTWFAAMVDTDTGGVVAPRLDPAVGTTSSLFALDVGDGACESLGDSEFSALSLTIVCEGEAPLGACCDMHVPQCAGGMNEGAPCGSNDDCEAPGTCEVVCRDLQQVNCSFPVPGQDLWPKWESGEACDASPFPSGIVCGTSACCHTNTQGEGSCEDLTRNECFAREPLDAPREWQLGRYCGLSGQACPLEPGFCEASSGDCFQPHAECGCQDVGCCAAVCWAFYELWWWTGPPWIPCDFWPCPFECCEDGWTGMQTAMAREVCDPFTVRNDDCFNPRAAKAAHPVDPERGAIAYVSDATQSPGDPAACCTREGHRAGRCAHTTEAEDPLLGTVWFAFVAPSEPAARVHVCPMSTGLLAAPVVQVLAPRDRQDAGAACESLSVIARSGHPAQCSSEGPSASVCVAGLTPGETYYAVVGAEALAAEAMFHVRVEGAVGCDVPLRVDEDGDGDVDLRDTAGLLRCFSGDGTPHECCGLLDVAPYDGRIDGHEVRKLSEVLSGPQ